MDLEFCPGLQLPRKTDDEIRYQLLLMLVLAVCNQIQDQSTRANER